MEREKFDILELEEQSEKGSVQSAVAKVQGKEDDSNKKKISKLVKEYNAYKKGKLLNFRFNPAKMSTQFGKVKKNFSCKFHYILFRFS